MQAVRFVMRLFTWVIVGLLVWDLYYFGPNTSVAVNAGLTLAERVTKASEGIPGLLRAGIDKVHKMLDSQDNAALASIFPLNYRAAIGPSDLPPDTLWAIQLASQRTGISIEYLMTTAYLEARFDTKAKSPTSSAAGMYQFIDSTWLSLMREHGRDYGWGGFAREIACTSSGYCKYAGADGKTRVLDLRYDGMTATFLSAELARKNAGELKAALGRDVSDAELYMAHFLGPAGAVTMIRNADGKKSVTAASLFPDAANANRPLFYGRAGAYTCAQFYSNMKDRWDAAFRTIALRAETDRKSGKLKAAADKTS